MQNTASQPVNENYAAMLGYVTKLRSIVVAHLVFWVVNLVLVIVSSLSYIGIVTLGHYLVSFYDLAGLIYAFQLLNLTQASLQHPNPFTRFANSAELMKNYRIVHFVSGLLWSVVLLLSIIFGSIGAAYGYIISLLLGALFTEVMLLVVNFQECLIIGEIRSKALGIQPIGMCGCDPHACAGADICHDTESQACCEYVQYNIQEQEKPPITSSTSNVAFTSMGSVTKPMSQTNVPSESLNMKSNVGNEKLREILTRYYYQVDASKLKEVGEFINFINANGLDEFNKIVVPIYGIPLVIEEDKEVVTV